MKTSRSNYLSVVSAVLFVSATFFFPAADAFALSPEEWQNQINARDYYDLIPDGEIAIVNDCGFTNGTSYKVLFGALHGVRVSGPNMPYFKGNNFVVTLGWGENGYTGPWGYEVFVEPRPQTFFVIIVGKTESIRPIWFMTWHKITGEEFEKYCGNYVPFKGRDMESTFKEIPYP